ncbi:phage tail tape measure protein [Niallia sp. 03091]|uniref:phage tail tape measure protein n=1 Tax=Niallia sp. 03091 TaxID=3458059 RepID=UPI004044C0E0
MAEGVIIRVGFDGTRVTQSLKSIKQAVAASTSQMKAEMRVFDNAGDTLGKLNAKYQGLERTIRAQDIQVQKLRESYDKAKEKFGENSVQALRFANQINNLTSRQESFRRQLQETQSEINEYNRGTNNIRQNLSLLIRETSAMSDTLRSQGRALQANRREYVGLKDQIKERVRLIDAEREKLQELIRTKGADDLATRRQRVALQELEAAQASAISRYNDLGRSVGNASNRVLGIRDRMNEFSNTMNNVGSRMTETGQNMTQTFGPGTLALGIGLGTATKKAMDFEAQMSSVKSVMSPDEVQKYSGSLEKLAITMGSKTKYSATEAAQGIEELIKAGVSVRDITNGGLSGALSLATAGELELKDAAEVASTALNAFRDDNISVARAADILAGSANASATDVGELKFGLSMVSAVASGVGLTFEDTSTALATFAQNGLKGSDAGTSLKTMLLNLSPHTKAASEMMDSLGLATQNTGAAYRWLSDRGIKPASKSTDDVAKGLEKLAKIQAGSGASAAKVAKEYDKLAKYSGFASSAFYDQNGNLKNMSQIAGILQNALKDLNSEQRQNALNVMFGTDAIRAGNILYKEGAKGINDMNAALNKVKAADVAEEKLNNLKGTVTLLKSSFETAGISIGNALIPALKWIAERTQTLVDKFNNLSPTMQSTIAIGAGVALAGGIIATGLGLAITAMGGLATGIGFVTRAGSTMIGMFDRAGRSMRGYRTQALETAASNEVLATSETAVNTAGNSSAGGSTRSSRRRGLFSRQSTRAVTEVGEEVAEVASRGGRLAKGAKILGGGIAGLSLVTSAIGLIGMNKDNAGSKLGDFGGSLGGGAAGAAIGSAIAPGIGTAIGGAIGAFAGSEAGKKLGQGISDYFKKTEIDKKLNFSKGIDSATKKALSSYTILSDQVNKKLIEMGITQAKVSKKNVDDLVSPYKQMSKKINQAFDDTNNSAKKNLNALTGLSKKEQDSILKSVNDGTDKKKKAVSDTEKEIEKIYKTAAKENRSINAYEQKQINKLQDKMNSYAAESMSKSAKQQKIILGDLRTHVRDLSASQAASVVKNSLKQEKATIKSAKNQYKKTVDNAEAQFKETISWADNQYYVQKNISKKQYDAIVQKAEDQKKDVIGKAKTQRDETIRNAEDTHINVVNEAKKQAKGHLDQVDWETGKILSNWDKFKISLADKVNWVTGGINKVLEFFHIPTIPKWSPTGSKTEKKLASNEPISRVSASAKGTRFHQGGYSLVGEEGVELAYRPGESFARLLGKNGPSIEKIRYGERILNARDTSAVMAGGLGKGTILPGYAKGNSSIGDYFDWLSNPLDKVKGLFKKHLNFGENEIGQDVGKNILSYLGDKTADFLKSKLSSGFIGGKAAGSKQVQAWLMEAMSITNTPMQFLPALSQIAMKESGGNPRAINLWDSNFKAGHPSKGLMQTIDSTFNAHKLPGHDDIWNPVDNAIAAIRYAISRYGSIANVPGVKALASGKGYIGYATGTDDHKGGDAILGDGGQEEPYLTPDGEFGISPKIPTLFKNFPAGSKVWPSIAKMKEDIPHFAKGTDNSFLKAITSAFDSFKKSLKNINSSFESSVKEAKQAYKTIVNENRSNAYSAYSLTDNARQGKVSGKGLLNNLQSQNSMYKRFVSNINKLKQKGASNKLINELLEQGVSTNADVEALLGLSKSDWKAYQGAYSDKTKRANTLGDLTTSFSAAGKDLNNAINKSSKKYQSGVKDALNDLNKSINKKKGTELSGHFVNGLVNGLVDKRGNLSKSASKLADSIEKSVRKKLKIHSPSLVGEELTGYFGQGLENGLYKAVDGVKKATKFVSGTISKHVVPINGTAAIAALQKATASSQQSGIQQINIQSNNDQSKIILLLQQQNQLLFQMLQGMQSTNAGITLNELANKLNNTNGKQYGINSFMAGGLG